MERDTTDSERSKTPSPPEDSAHASSPALTQHEERFQALASATFEGIAVSVDGRYVDANDQLLAMLGYTRAELIGRPITDAIAPHDRERVLQNIQSGRESLLEHTMVRKDGSQLIAEAHGKTIDYQGRKVRFTAIRDITGRKRREEQLQITEAALRIRERQMRLLIDSIPGLISYIDKDRRYVLANQQYQAWFELSGIVGKTMYEVLGDEAMRRLEPYVEQVLEGHSVSFEVEAPYERGPARWIDAHYVPDRDATGRVAGFFVLVLDITARKRAEQALQQSEQRHRALAVELEAEQAKLRAIIENLPVCVGVGTPDGRILSFNRAGLELHGFHSEQEMLGRVADYREEFELFYLDGRLMPIEEWPAARAIRGEFVSNYEVRLCRKSQQWERIVCYSVAPVRNRRGEMLLIVYVVQDLTSQKETEQALRDSEAKFRMIADNISQLAWMGDEKGALSWFNRRWFEFTGTTPEEMSGDGWQKVHHPEHVQRVITRFGSCMESGEPWEDTFPIRGKDGTYRWFLSRAMPIRDSTGKVVRWFGTNTDVTEQRQIEEALRHAQEQLRRHADHLEVTVRERTAKLQELVGELEHFSYTITHDMRAPLRAMRGFAELAKEVGDPGVTPELRLFLGKIVSAAERMDLLITDALSYSKAVRQELPLAPVDVGALLRGMLDSYPEFQPSRARISLEDDLPAVLGNEAGLVQCFSNLLGNAVKFVRPGVMPEVRVRAELSGEWVRFWVEDNGIGIHPTMLPRMFEMFSRGEHGYEGTGIGLALVRKVVTRMQGRVGAESELAKGSRFWIELQKA